MKSKNKTRILVLVLTAVLGIAISEPVSADQIILSPDADGFQTNLSLFGAGSNWQAVETDDGDTSYVYTDNSGFTFDFYTLEDVGLSGTINWVRVYIMARAVSTPNQESARTAIRTEGGNYFVTVSTLGTSFSERYTEYTTNPEVGGSWTWAQINALEAGVSLKDATSGPTDNESICTRVWVVVDYTPEECEWQAETAWADGNRYVEQGNWATYTTYEGEELDVTLYAGQTMDAGAVEFSAPEEGYVTITIILNPGWRFADVAENVKIQDYAEAPSGNPSPGLFAHKDYATESPFEIEVPANSYYGVHVDVEYCPSMIEEI